MVVITVSCSPAWKRRRGGDARRKNVAPLGGVVLRGKVNSMRKKRIEATSRSIAALSRRHPRVCGRCGPVPATTFPAASGS